MKLGILFAILMVLVPTAVSADELWVKNEGGVEVTIWSDSNWQEVTVTGNQGLMGVGPGWEPADGVAKVAAVTVPNTEWLVIHADNITDYHIDVACNQRYEDIMPEVRLVKDEPVAPLSEPVVASKPIQDYDSGPSIAEVTSEPEPTSEAATRAQPETEPTLEPEPIVYDWTGQEVWLYT